MPDKTSGEHRWIILATYLGVQLSAAGPKLLDQNNLLDVNAVCIDCEQPWSPELEDQPCAAPAFDWNKSREAS